SLSGGRTQMVAIGSISYFAADDGVHGLELWKTDGTAAGTVLVHGINPRSGAPAPGNLSNVNGTLFFTADGGVHGAAVLTSGVTAAGTSLVKDIHPGGESSYAYALTNVNGTLFFSASDGASAGAARWELWKSDGTAAGTVWLAGLFSSCINLTNVNGTLFFA